MIPRVIGNYQLERELGRGGVAAVYLARHKSLPRQVAIKVLLNHSEEQLERFRREAELTSKLHHPNIVEIYDSGMQGPFAYTIMEVALGGSLRRRLENAPQHRLLLDESLRIFRQIGDALDFAHTKGIIHRDVSPGNVLLDPNGTRALLADFGIARVENQSGNTATKWIMGTPGYLSPEHLESARDVTAQSDIFSLGLLLYMMLAGRLPWENMADNPRIILSIPPLPLSSLADLPPAIDPIMLTLLAVEGRHRYSSAREAIEALQRVFPGHLSLSDVVETAAPAARSLYVTSGFKPSGVRPNDVEMALGPQLGRKVIDRIHQRAELLGQPEPLVALLESWSREKRFRRRHLGRLATFHESQSFNVYFYEMDVLFETRGDAFIWEQPDRERKPMTGALEVGVWDVTLPKPTVFEAQEGTVNEIPGSDKVSHCSKCNGKSNILCNTCRGNGRITETRTIEKPVEVKDSEGKITRSTTTTVENIVKPCHECHGKGFVVCPTCEGIGMVVQRKGFKWKRQTATIHGRDELPEVDEDALKAEALEIYDQTHQGILPAWKNVAGLASLITNVESLIDDHTKVVLARVRIEVVPVTKVRFEHNRGADAFLQTSKVELVDDDHDPDTPSVITVEQDEADEQTGDMFDVHLLGFNNTISEAEAQRLRDWPRLLNLGTIVFLMILIVVMLIFIVLVYR